MASRADIQISILKFNFQPKFWFHFQFPYRGWISNMLGQINISISEFNFDFQIFVLPYITQCRIGLHNIMLITMLICHILCLTLYIWYIYSTFFIGYSALIFTLFIANIVTLYTFFHRIYVGWCTRTWYAFDIRCTKPHLVPPASYTLSYFVAFIFYTFLT